MQRCEGVRPHDPDEKPFVQQRPQSIKQIGGVMRARPAFQVQHAETRIAPGHLARQSQTAFQIGHVAGILQRIAGGHQPPYLVQPQTPEGLLGHREMAGVGRIEGAAEKSDPTAGNQRRRNARCRQKSGHGRVCPSPRT